jgi:Phosphate uptake regulator
MVSLPAEWVKEVGLSPGESVYLEVDEDGSLKVYPPNMKLQNAAKEVKVLLSNNIMPEIVTRIIYGLYILGFDKIEIESKDKLFNEDILRKVKEAVRSLIGYEITVQNVDYIQIQSFLDPTKYTMTSLLNRLINNLKQMLHYLSLGIKEGSRTFLQETIELEKEVDRLYYLALRQLILSQSNRSLAYMIGVKRIQLIGNRILIKAIEESADEISEAATDLLTLTPQELEEVKNYWNNMFDLIEQSTAIIDHTMKVLTKEDAKLINETMEELRTLRRVLISEATNIENSTSNIKNYRILIAIRTVNLRLYNAIRRMEPIVEIAFNRSLENNKEIVID